MIMADKTTEDLVKESGGSDFLPAEPLPAEPEDLEDIEPYEHATPVDEPDGPFGDGMK
jgi:hypothetical protein